MSLIFLFIFLPNLGQNSQVKRGWLLCWKQAGSSAPRETSGTRKAEGSSRILYKELSWVPGAVSLSGEQTTAPPEGVVSSWFLLPFCTPSGLEWAGLQTAKGPDINGTIRLFLGKLTNEPEWKFLSVLGANSISLVKSGLGQICWSSASADYESIEIPRKPVKRGRTAGANRETEAGGSPPF